MDLAALPLKELLKVCSESGSVDEWEEFIRRTNKLLYGTIRRTCNRYGLPVADLIDDLLQDIYLKLAVNREQILQRFVEQNPDGIYSYLKIMAVNLVNDFCRSKEAARRRASHTVFLEDVAVSSAPARDPSNEIEREVLLGQVDHILQRYLQGSSSKRDRSIFWLYYRQGLTSKAIASIPGIDLSIKGVETVIHRLTRAVREEMGADSTRRAQTEGKSVANPLLKEGGG